MLVKSNKELLEKIECSTTDNEIKDVIHYMLKSSPLGFFNTLKAPQCKKLYDFIMQKTSFIDFDANISTRVWYVLNEIDHILECHNPNCHNKIRIQLKPVAELHQLNHWCSVKCFNTDPYSKNNISAKTVLIIEARLEKKKDSVAKNFRQNVSSNTKKSLQSMMMK